MFDKVLIANRGEIALRVLRACRELGIQTVAVHSTADEEAMHVRLADESVCIGPPRAHDSYLNIPAIVSACEITGAEAVHPGYGFLSENARFADILTEHGIKFIGPSAEHIRIMGDKIEAKRTARELGIPVVPGSEAGIGDIDEGRRIAREIGYPVLIKATAGGGGRGMKVARNESELENALQTAQAEAKAAFGNGDVYLEKYLEHPRHIEIQVLGDGQGRAIHLGERDCSLQRRHQKIWEEAHSPALNAAERDLIGGQVSRAMAKLGYEGVGTVEFLFENGEFFFIEMNTRLQVEHPVTEMLTGLDLVQEQIRIAAGAELKYEQKDITFTGHAIECRINAENPHTFVASPGRVDAVHVPGGLGVRIDSAIYAGYGIPPYYDSLIGKLVVFGKTRTECLMRLRRALGEYVIEGVETTIPLFQRLVTEPDIIDGHYDIHWLEKFLSRSGLMSTITPQILLKAYAAGIFPMAESADDNALYWIEPEERGVFPLDKFHVPRSLRKRIIQRRFDVRIDTAFSDVIGACSAKMPGRMTTWINSRIRALYNQLYKMGCCHTVECWQGEQLVGGLYGVRIGAAFFGESMFSRAPDASKIALVHLVARLKAGGFILLDAQFMTPHLARFGARAIGRDDYRALLEEAIDRDADFFAFKEDRDAERVLGLAAGTR